MLRPEMKTLTCPNCGTQIPLEEAVTHQIREELQRDFQAKSAQREKLLKDREAKLANVREQLDQKQQSLEREIERGVKAQIDQLREQTRKQAESALGLQMQDLRLELGEKEKKLAEATEVELQLRRKQREMESRHRELELEVARRIDEEREKIRETAMTVAAEEQQQRLSEKEKLIADLQKQIEVLKQKAQQGSQQLQGETLELTLESLLRQKFPSDEIVPVLNGVRGADLLQQVRTALALECGKIIWEIKSARNWMQSWIAKLKENQRSEKAEVAILVTQALPPGVRAFEFIDGVWVTDPASAVPLAMALRQGLVTIANSCLASEGKAGKMELLYEYLIGIEFRQKIEAVVEAFVTMKTDLESEKRAFAKIWARREKQIEQAITNTALMYGSIQGIVGQSSLPEIASLQLVEANDSSENGEQ